jgi:hypothetical protein
MIGLVEHDAQIDTAGLSPSPQVARKDRGVYYTPDSLADLVVDLALRPVLERAERTRDLIGLSILDPAVGRGAFFLAAARAIRHRLRTLEPAASVRRITAMLRSLVRDGFVGIDVDPRSARLTSLALELECLGASAAGEEAFGMLSAEDALQGPSELAGRRWDAILCNPPWGKVKPNVREYYAALDPSVRARQGSELRRYIDDNHGERREQYVRYSTEMLRRATALRRSSGSPASRHRDGRKTVGDLDYYRFFLERIFDWSSPETRFGLILPIAFLNTEGASGLRRLYLENGTFEHLLSFENRERIFPIHGMYRFSVAIYARGSPRGIANAATRLLTTSDARKQVYRTVSLDRAFLSCASPYYGIIPIIGDIRARDLLARLRSQYPGMSERSSLWNARFRRECDMTQDAASFVPAGDLMVDRQLTDCSIVAGGNRYLPVYEGRMVAQFDSRAKVYVDGAGRLAKWRERRDGDRTLSPHYYMHERDARRLLGRESFGVRASYCDISGHANERTILAALIPSGAICGNKVPVVEFEADDERLPRLWVACANSVVVDWVARHLVSTTINFFYWNDIPLPFIVPTSADAALVVSAVETLHHVKSRETKGGDLVRGALDAYVAYRFGLSDRELRVVLSDFRCLYRTDSESGVADWIVRCLRLLRDGAPLAELMPTSP